MKLLVPGGNGFIGTHICRIAVQNDHDVAAFGRTGRPPLAPDRHPWTKKVEWRAADVFAPDTWRDLLEGTDAVVHCIATISETPSKNITFDQVNAGSALRAAREAVDAGASSFVFLSVRDTPPIVPESFLAAKRRVERQIPKQYPELRTVSLRPNLVFGPGQWGSATLAALLQRLPDDICGPYASVGGRPLPVEVVAAAAVHAATTQAIEGTLSVRQIDDLGRTSGLLSPDEISDPSIAPLLAGVGGTLVAAWLLYRWRS